LADLNGRADVSRLSIPWAFVRRYSAPQMKLLFVAVILGICREKGSTDANIH